MMAFAGSEWRGGGARAGHLPAPRDGEIPGHWKSSPAGSIGGPVIWVMEEAWMPSVCRCDVAGRVECPRHRGYGRAREGGAGAPVDPDGFAVYGRFPRGFLRRLLRLQILGTTNPDDILHVCSGTLSASERWTVDIRPQAKPLVIADGAALPFREASFRAVLIDPPYSDTYAKNLYGTGNPRPSWLLREAARVVKPGGRIGMLHVAVPFKPPGCRLLKVYGISCGTGFRIRALTVYERHGESLFAADGGR